MLSPSLLFYFSYTSPWLHYVPAVWNNLYFVALLNTFCVLFSFLSSRSCFTLCCSLSVFLLVDIYPLFLLRSPVIWFIVFTAVNFHLVLFFFQFFIRPPAPAAGCCIVVVVLGGGRVILDSSYIAPCPSLLLWPLPCDFMPCSLYPRPPSPLHGVCRLVTCSCCSGATFLLSPGIPPHTTFLPYTPKPPPLPSWWLTPLLPTATVTSTWGPFPSPVAMVLITTQSASSKSGEGGGGGSQ